MGEQPQPGVAFVRATCPPATLPNQGSGTQPVDTASASEQVPAAAAPDPSSNGTGEVPTAGQVSSEGQNPNDISIATPEKPAAEPAGGEASTEMGPGAEQTAGMEPPSAEAPSPTVEPEPVPDEPEPIVRPALNCGAPPPPLQGGIQGFRLKTKAPSAGRRSPNI